MFCDSSTKRYLSSFLVKLSIASVYELTTITAKRSNAFASFLEKKNTSSIRE
jgi:hypothetical protein